MGHAKTDFSVTRRLEQRVEREDRDFYNYCVRLCRSAAHAGLTN
jgi:hypothetical protein